jgi:hypothetical protein
MLDLGGENKEKKIRKKKKKEKRREEGRKAKPQNSIME